MTQIQALVHGEVITGTHLLQSRSEKDLTRAGSNECVCVLISRRLQAAARGRWGALWRSCLGLTAKGALESRCWARRRYLRPALEDKTQSSRAALQRHPGPYVLRSGQGAQSSFCWKGPSITEVTPLISQIGRLEPREAKGLTQGQITSSGYDVSHCHSRNMLYENQKSGRVHMRLGGKDLSQGT